MCPIIPREPQAALGLHAVLVEVPAVEVGVGHDGAPRDLVERDVLSGELGRCRDDDCVRDPVRIRDRPLQRLHRAEAAAHDGGETADAQAVGQPCLHLHPVLAGEYREARAVRLAGGG
jgi:hypothetical protein